MDRVLQTSGELRITRKAGSRMQLTHRGRRSGPNSGRARFARSLIAVSLAALAAGCTRPGPAASRPVPVTAFPLAAQPAAVTEEYPAQLEASNTVEIRPRVGGVLEKQAAAEGQPVKAGQVLFVIDREPYVAALAQAKATLAQNEAAQAKAERDLARAKPLTKGDLLSQRELDAAIAANDSTTAQVAAARAAVRTAELNLGYTNVSAPIDGVMSRAQIRLGGLVSAYNSLLTTVFQTDPMYVNFSVSEQRLLELQRDLGRAPEQSNPSHRLFRVYTSDGQQAADTRVARLHRPRGGLADQTLPIRLTMPNPRGLLRAGQYVTVVTSTATRARRPARSAARRSGAAGQAFRLDRRRQRPSAAARRRAGCTHRIELDRAGRFGAR